MGGMRKIIDFSIGLIGKARQNQKIVALKDERDGLVKVNLGCGLRVARGWLNIDGSLNAMAASWPASVRNVLYRLSGAKHYYTLDQYCDILKNHRFMYHDLALSLPLHNSSVDFIYSSHFFEHLFKDDAEALLKSCRRALKPGGIIRISIPDLAYAISLYSEGKKREMLDDYFFVEGKGSYLARHKYMYDFDLIRESLEGSGFVNIVRCEYQMGRTPDIDVLDVYPEMSLFVEAEKGKSDD